MLRKIRSKLGLGEVTILYIMAIGWTTLVSIGLFFKPEPRERVDTDASGNNGVLVNGVYIPR